MTNLTYGILPSFLWSLIMPIMYLVSVDVHPCGTRELSHPPVTHFLFWFQQIRFFTNTFTLTPYNGAEALVRCQRRCYENTSAVNEPSSLCFLFTALAVSSKTGGSGSKSKVSQFDIRTRNKLHSPSTGE